MKLNRVTQSNNMLCALHTYQQDKARSRLMQKIQNQHKEKLDQFNSAGRTTLRAGLHGDEESAVDEAVTAAMEWNMVRIDLLAYWKLLFMSYYVTKNF